MGDAENVARRWFEFVKAQGYQGNFDEFITEVVETHFSKCHGMMFPWVIQEPQKLAS